MIELLFISFQILFILTILIFSFYQLVDKLKINYFDLIEATSINLILILNLLLIFSLINIPSIYVILIICFVALVSLLSKLKNNLKFIKSNIINLIFLFLVIFIISINLATDLYLEWDAKFFWYFKTLNFYQNENIENLKNLIAPDYPHLGSYIWSLFWKYPLNINEFYGRIFYVVIYAVSIFSFFENLGIDKKIKILFIILTLITTYKYSYFAGLQEILVFSFILLATKFSFYISEEKNSNIQNKLIFYLLCITNVIAWIKNEGFIFMLILNFCLIISFKINYKGKIYLIFGSALILLFRFLFMSFFDLTFESSEFSKTFNLSSLNISDFFDDLKIITFYLMVNITRIPILLVCLPILAYIVFLDKENARIKMFIIFFSIISLIFIYVSFMFNFEDVEWQTRVGIGRVLLQFSGFYLLTIIFVLKKLKRQLP